MILEKMSESEKNDNIWYEVTEDTKKILITNEDPESQNIKFFKADKPKHGGFDLNKLGIIKPPKYVVINLIDYLGLELKNLENMPQNLPNLETLSIRNLNLKSLKGITKKLPNLKLLGIINLKNLRTLKELPKSLPNLKRLGITNSSSIKTLKGLPNELSSLEKIYINNVPLESLQYLPKSLPHLEKFTVIQTNIQNLEYFPSVVPELKEITLLRNKLVSLRGIPSEIPGLEKLWISHNQITSLEHLPYKFQKRNLDSRDKERLKHNLSVDPYNPIYFMVDHNPISTLAGIKFPKFFRAMVTFIACWNAFTCRYHPSKIPPGSHICPTGLKLIRDYYEKKIEVETLELNMSTSETITHKMIDDPARYDAIVEFYRKTPMELAQQYIENPNSLTDGELERLGWEGGYQERQLLETNIPADHALLKEISQRLIHQLPSGFSILK